MPPPFLADTNLRYSYAPHQAAARPGGPKHHVVRLDERYQRAPVPQAAHPHHARHHHSQLPLPPTLAAPPVRASPLAGFALRVHGPRLQCATARAPALRDCSPTSRTSASGSASTPHLATPGALPLAAFARSPRSRALGGTSMHRAWAGLDESGTKDGEGAYPGAARASR
ncbi:hypothetical protein B0H14DRAFT_3436826 [Mycena olivaceomarginata]|nr:hypothetical protein B0H14DRAFT_3436826 [Mycena olivaceomarginata]